MAVSPLETRRRLDTADGGRVSGVVEMAPEAGAVQTGIFAVDGFADGVTAAVREMPGEFTWGTATIPLRARGTAMMVAPIPSAAMREVSANAEAPSKDIRNSFPRRSVCRIRLPGWTDQASGRSPLRMLMTCTTSPKTISNQQLHTDAVSIDSHASIASEVPTKPPAPATPTITRARMTPNFTIRRR